MLRPRVCVVAALLLLASLACAQDASTQQSDVQQVAGDVGDADPANRTTAGNSTALPLASPEPMDIANRSSSSSSSSSGGGSSSMMAPTPARVDQPLPFFKGVRSCLPFNILIAAPQRPPEGGDGNVAQITNGRITIVADPSVINAAAVAVEDDILTLSLVGEGFFSTQPVVFIVTAPPTGGDLQSVTNSGSGAVVLGPGLNTSNLRLTASRVGEVRAINITANSLTYTGSGAFGSSLTGAFSEVSINTGATGTVVLASVTPVNVTVDLQGITTLKVAAPAGSAISGRAAGLSSVQHTANTTCQLGSQSGSLLGDVFGNRCTDVSTNVITAALEGTDNPQWTCGVVVDGQLSCAGRNVTNREDVPLELLSGTGEGEPGTANPNPDTSTANGANFTEGTSPDGFDNTTAASTGNTTDAISGGGSKGEANTTAAGNAANNTGSSGNPNTAIPSPAPTTDVIGGGNIAGTNSGAGQLTGTVDPIPGSATGARRLLRDTSTGRRSLLQFSFPPFPSFPAFPPIPTTTSFSPTGTLTTGSFTSGPGTFSSSSTTSGGKTQTTISQGGSPPVTTTSNRTGSSSSFFNPVFVQPDENAGAAETPAASPIPAPSPSQQSSVSISLGGEGSTGVAVVNTQCAVNGSLSMLLTGTDATGRWVQPGASGSSDGNTTTTTTGGNTTTGGGGGGGNAALNGGGNATNTTAASSPAVGENMAGGRNTGGAGGQTGSNATTNAVSGNAAGTGA